MDTSRIELPPTNEWHDSTYLTGWDPTVQSGLDGHIDRIIEPLGRIYEEHRTLVDPECDLFNEHVKFETIAAVFSIMAVCERHTFIVTVENTARMAEFFKWIALTEWPKLFPNGVGEHKIESNVVLQHAPGDHHEDDCPTCGEGGCHIIADNIPAPWPLTNVWLAAKIQTQADANARIPMLCQTPAAMHLAWIDNPTETVRLEAIQTAPYGPMHGRPGVTWAPLWNALAKPKTRKPGEVVLVPATPTLDGVIASGRKNPIHPAWIRSLESQCEAQGRPFHFTGWGAWLPIDQALTDDQQHAHAAARFSEYINKDGDRVNQEDDLDDLYDNNDWSNVCMTGATNAGFTLDGITHSESPRDERNAKK